MFLCLLFFSPSFFSISRIPACLTRLLPPLFLSLFSLSLCCLCVDIVAVDFKFLEDFYFFSGVVAPKGPKTGRQRAKWGSGAQNVDTYMHEGLISCKRGYLTGHIHPTSSLFSFRFAFFSVVKGSLLILYFLSILMLNTTERYSATMSTRTIHIAWILSLFLPLLPRGKANSY